MRLPLYSTLILGLFLGQCSEKILNPQDIVDLLDSKNSTTGGSSSSSDSQSSTNQTNNQNATPISNSQNLDYNGLTNSPTGTNTYGATGAAPGNPLGR